MFHICPFSIKIIHFDQIQKKRLTEGPLLEVTLGGEYVSGGPLRGAKVGGKIRTIFLILPTVRKSPPGLKFNPSHQTP